MLSDHEKAMYEVTSRIMDAVGKCNMPDAILCITGALAEIILAIPETSRRKVLYYNTMESLRDLLDSMDDKLFVRTRT